MKIGTFKSTGVGFAGNIKTLTLNIEVTLEPNRKKQSDKVPDFHLFHGTDEIGTGYKKATEEGLEYINIKFDDPSFAYPVYCSIFPNSQREELSVSWNRPKKKA